MLPQRPKLQGRNAYVRDQDRGRIPALETGAARVGEKETSPI